MDYFFYEISAAKLLENIETFIGQFYCRLVLSLLKPAQLSRLIRIIDPVIIRLSCYQFL